jgi:hypothetical protein
VNGLANAVLFHIGWFASVLGAATGHPFAGPIVVALLLVAHLRLFGTRREAILILASAALGALAESALGLTGWLSYRSHPGPSWLCPPWIVAMWVNFGMTLRHSLRWLEGRRAFAALIGGFFGPFAYVAGSRLGAIELVQPGPALIALGVVWALSLAGLVRVSTILPTK